MSWIPDAAIAHLRSVVDEPDLSGTRYRITGRLGRGGMGAVYRADDAELGREVALKVLAIPDDGGAIAARMLEEARILARLEHPGIVPVHDVGTLADGRVFYVMKLVRGRRLDEQPAASAAEAVRLARRICDAVAFAHAHGIVHRDLKPENVMVGAFGEVLVLDWGVAKVLGEAERKAVAAGAQAGHATAVGDRIGTPGWMAPEQSDGDPAAIDARTDVFGLGALLLFLLAGARPTGNAVSRTDVGGKPGSWGSGRLAHGLTGAAAARLVGGATAPAIQHEDRIRSLLRRHHPPLPRRLRAVVARALAYRQEDRYGSVEALAADLDRYLDGSPVSAHRENPIERAAAFASRYRTPIALILSYIAMRVLLLVFGGT